MIAWEKCAEANERTGNDWHAGKHLEQCAQLAKDLKQHDQVVAYAERACAAYVSAGRAQRGAECLGKTARLIDEAAPDDAYALAIKACTMLEDDDKASYARDFYSLAGAIRMRQEMFAEAAETMLRFGASCDAGEAHASLRKAYLSAIVAHLYAGDGAEAQSCYGAFIWLFGYLVISVWAIRLTPCFVYSGCIRRFVVSGQRGATMRVRAGVRVPGRRRRRGHQRDRAVQRADVPGRALRASRPEVTEAGARFEGDLVRDGRRRRSGGDGGALHGGGRRRRGWG